MKILIYCDLHNEFGILELEQTDYDAVVLAGDTDVGIRGAKWALEVFKDIPIIYICGNHEYYSKKIYKVHRQLRELSNDSNFFFLENEELILGNVKFLGCTLWTDFSICGNEKMGLAMFEAQRLMTDFNSIRLGPENRYRKLKPADTVCFHNDSVRFLKERLEKPFAGPTIIVTHHLPSSKSISEEFKSDILNGAFCSDLEWMIKEYTPEFWIHGHTHTEFDYMIDRTRIICNPRGYFPNIVKGFQENLVIEI